MGHGGFAMRARWSSTCSGVTLASSGSDAKSTRS